MDQDIKNNKIKCFGTSIQFLQNSKGACNKTYICEITTYFCSFSVYRKYYAPLLNVRWMLCILFLFLFQPPFNDLQWKVRKPPNKNEKA